MEKPKAKDDMLAAGKKRLEQFRQKKQGKGSTSKNAKPETDLGQGRQRVHVERTSSKGSKAKGSTRRTLSESSEDSSIRSDSGRNELSIDLSVVGADDTDSQSNAKPISASVSDHPSARASNFEENPLEQCRETGQEQQQTGDNELCSRNSSLEPSGLDPNCSPPITDNVKARVESESLVEGFDTSNVTVAPDLSISMGELLVLNTDANHSLMNYDRSITEPSDERVVTNSFDLDHAEAVQECDQKQELMNLEESSAPESPRFNQPVATIAMLHTEHGDKMASELHVDSEHTQSANFSGESHSELAASLQDFSLQSVSKEEEKETSSPGHELDSGAAGIPSDANTASDNVEQLEVGTQVENKEQNSSSSCDAETAIDYLSESKSQRELDTVMADTDQITGSGTKLPLSLIFETSAAANFMEHNCADIVMGLGSDACSHTEQPPTGEVLEADSSRDLTGIPSDSNLNQVGLCGLKTSADDNYDDGIPSVLTAELTSTAGKEVTGLDASEPADETMGLNCVKKTALLGDMVDDSRSIDKDVESVSPNIDGSACEAGILRTSEEAINVSLDQTDSEERSGSSGFHEVVEEGDLSKETEVNAEMTVAVEMDQEAIKSVHVEGSPNLIQESSSGDDLSCPSSAHIFEAKQAITEEDQVLKTNGSSIDVGSGKEMEEIVTSDAFHHTLNEALIHGSDSGSGFAGSTMPASAKFEVECKTALNPEDMDDSLDSDLVPSKKIEEVHDMVEEVTNEGFDTSTAEVVSQLQTDKVMEAFNPGQDRTEGVTVPVTNVQPLSELNTRLLEHEEDARHSGSEAINTGLETFMAEVISQLQMDKVVEEFVPGQNLAEGVVPIVNLCPSSELNTSFSEHEESARPDSLCSQELCRTEVLSDRQIDDPDIAQPVVAADSNLSYRIEEVGDALPGSSHTKHELDTIAVAAELRSSNAVDNRADTLLSRNASAEHSFENLSPPMKDDLPLQMLSGDGHDHEADLKFDSIHRSLPSLTSGLTSDPDYTDNIWQVPISEGTLNSGDDAKFIERNTEREQESSEVSAFELATQSCSKSKPEYESVVLESCNSSEIVSPFREYALPLEVTPDEVFEEETEHLLQKPHSQDLSRDVVADSYQNDTVGSSVANTQERHSLSGQSSRSFDKCDLASESVQEQTWMEQNSREFNKATLNEEAGHGNMINFGASQHVEDGEFGEHSRSNNTGGSLSSGFELQGEQEGENVIGELREALCMKETEMENYALLLNFQAAKNSEERGMAEEVLTQIVKRLANLASQGSSVNEDGDLHKQNLKIFDVDNGGLERAEWMNFDHFLQASNYWMDELHKELEEKRQTETMRRQLEVELLMKDSLVKSLTEKVEELSQDCDELQKDSEQIKDLEIKAMQWEELSIAKDTEIGRLSDRVSELSQNYDLVMDELAKVMEERHNLEGELKYFQKLYAEQESKANQMEELLSIKDNDLEMHFNKVAELSQNYDMAMSEVAKLAEERLSLASELLHYQRLSAEQEEEHSKMCKQANALADRVASLLGPSSMDVDSIHGDAIETLENLVVSLRGHYETVCRENKDLLLMANNSEGASQVEINNLRAHLSSKEVEQAHLQESVNSLTNELIKTRDDGEKKVQEAEQKALGVRERLSLAVTKGKGLVQQRDNLKQLLAEKTAECETLASSFKQELHLKTVALNEADSRAKFNSEAVEHVEALESELSYIRNSANALRESFLQKDAVLQKIEELFEDANLSEDLQIKDIFEKVEWLLETNTQKTSILEGQIHSEAVATREMHAFPVAEQGSQMQENDNLNRKYDELLRKYRDMAEQSAMLEQSLLERNLLIQRWEEVLDAVDMPASVRVKEPDDKIKWLGTTVSDAHASIAHFQAEIESLQTTFEVVNNASQKLQEENAVLSMELAATKDELKTVALDYNNLSKPTCQDDIPLAQAVLQGPEESELKQEVSQQPGFQIKDLEAFATNIRSLLSEIMQKDEVDNIFSGGLASTALENSVRLLVEKNKWWSTEATEAKGKLAELTLAARLTENDREKELQSLHEALSLKTLELNDLTMQLEDFAMKNSLLEDEVGNLQKTVKAKSEELSSAKDELAKLQLEVSQLEDKLASTREKLSMAVKKGKSVVQQRDTLKQSLDEKTTELGQTRKELEAENLAFTNAKQSLKHHLQQMEMLETEFLASRNYASGLEKSVQESNRALQKFAEAVDKISISGAPRSGDLGEKIQWISQLVVDLQRKAGISEQEAKKSRKTSELLSLELEEVQGRMDSFAEELMHAEKNISLLIEEKKLAEASKAEAGLRLEHAMANINSLLFELSESKENQSNLEQENNSLKDSLSAQMEEIRYKQAKAENQLKDLSDLHSKMYHLRTNQSSFLGMVADQIFNLSEDTRGTKNLLLRISGELKDQGFMSLLTAPVLVNNSFSKWQPEKTVHEWKQGVTTGSLKFLCDEMETELQDFENNFKNFVTASNQDATAISQSLMEIWDGLGPLSQRMSSTESLALQKDEHISGLEGVLKAVTGRLRYTIKEIEDFKEEAQKHVSQSGSSSLQLLDGEVLSTSYENLHAVAFSLVERLSSLAKDLACSHQEDDIQKERQNENLRNQLSKARAVIDAMDHQQQVDKLKNSELQKCLEDFEIREEKTNQELSSLNDVLSTENQEKQGLLQALNNAEMKVEELEKAKQELEASLGKASSRFYTTATNFNRFQSLSEKLIEEAESLHLLLEDRDAQISLLKEEVDLKGSEMTSLQNLVNERTADLSQLYQKIGEIVNRDASSSGSSRLERQTGSREELLEALATSVRAGAESLQVQLARKDALLQDVQLRHDDLARQVSVLESSLLENQRLTEERGNTSVIDRMMVSAEAEDKGNRGKHVTPSVAVVTHGRSGRKVSAPSDHLTLDVDTESSRLMADMDDEAKGHVFKPLTSSRIVPRGTRILVDRLDGLWVSGERLLRRRPGARLSIMLYWLVLHVWMVAILL